MPNWDRYCTECDFLGSYLDFRPSTGADPEEQTCDREDDCGATVAWMRCDHCLDTDCEGDCHEQGVCDCDEDDEDDEDNDEDVEAAARG